MSKVINKFKDDKKIDSSLIIHDRQYLNKVLDKLNNALVVYDTLADTNANKMSETLAGNTTQYTTVGKNLLNYYNQLRDKIKVEDDVLSLKEVTTTASDDSRAWTNWNTVDLKIKLEAGTYTLSIIKVVQPSVVISRLEIINESGNILADSAEKMKKDSVTFRLAEATEIGIIAKLFDAQIKLQLEEGDTATVFEPYTGTEPSPNPGFPQRINNATGKHILNVAVADTTTQFDVDFGSMELCKIGEYQDRIKLVNKKWIKEKNIEKENLSNEKWDISRYAPASENSYYFNSDKMSSLFKSDNVFSNLFLSTTAGKLWDGTKQRYSN